MGAQNSIVLPTGRFTPAELFGQLADFNATITSGGVTDSSVDFSNASKAFWAILANSVTGGPIASGDDFHVEPQKSANGTTNFEAALGGDSNAVSSPTLDGHIWQLKLPAVINTAGPFVVFTPFIDVDPDMPFMRLRFFHAGFTSWVGAVIGISMPGPGAPNFQHSLLSTGKMSDSGTLV